MTALKVLLACLLLAAAWVVAQGPINDQVTVEFNNPVVVGDTTLPAGRYHIRQIATANNPRLFEFISDSEGRTEATASATAVADNLVRHPTSVTLTQKGNNYYVSRMWIAGETYGYEFTAPEGGQEMEVAARTQSANGLRMTGTYTPGAGGTQTAQQTGANATQQAEADRQRQEQERAEQERAAAQRAEQERAAAQRAEEERAAAQRAEQERQREEQERAAAQRAEEERQRQEAERAAAQRAEEERARREQERTEVAQARPPQQQETPAAQQPAQTEAGGAAQMPDTAAGWPTMTLGGMALMALGALARRFGR